mmetsp:Transcript_27661/g.56785  ORF Transcript_27661/g.56785 Transcript_27661/m.56785 type:complete len:215 (-) Transcript_27661:230-874(-)
MSTALSSSFTPHNHLHEHGGAEVRVRVPPVGRAAGGAARAQDALVHAVQLLAVHLGLEVLPLPLRFGGLGLEPRLNRGVLLREVGHVGHQVLDHVHVRQGVDLHRCSRGLVDVRQAGQGVAAVNVHGAGPADPFAAASAEAKRGVEFILDFQKSIEDHGAAFVRVDGVSADVWFLVLVRVISVDLECFDVLCLRASVHKTLAPRQTDTNIGALR